MLVKDLVAAMERIAPLEHAETWDKVGLLVGSSARELKGPVLLTIDLTERVLAEAERKKAGAIIAYHPPIFDPLARITNASAQQRIVLRSIELGLAIYSPHTALDAVPGGICDWICEGLSGGSPGKIHGDCRALVPHPSREPTQEVKIVTFLPSDKVDHVRNAMATAGAGIIGNYQVCSFSTPGTGTFLPLEGASPTIGKPGTLEHTAELRLEMVCSRLALPLALQTLRRFHPYEEPAIDVYCLEPKPQREFGPGRRLVLDRPATVRELAQRLKTFLKTSSVRLAQAEHAGSIKTIGVCPGSGGDFASIARQEGCEAYVTGELSHHKVLAALHSGMSVILGEHTGTERGYLPRLALRLKELLPGLAVEHAEADRDPLEPI
jgi:dinuclear metal center YbgI/SA1388 family protein